MELTIKYFGMLAEQTGKTEEQISFEGGSLKELISQLKTKYPVLATLEFQVAVNQKIDAGDTLITNQEIALLPPFSGG